MADAAQDIIIEQGATLGWNVRWKIGAAFVDLGGYTARMQIRPAIGSEPVLVGLTTENGGLTLGDEGSITMNMSATATALLGPSWPTDSKGRMVAVYGLELISQSGEVTRLLQGRAILAPEVVV